MSVAWDWIFNQHCLTSSDFSIPSNRSVLNCSFLQNRWVFFWNMTTPRALWQWAAGLHVKTASEMTTTTTSCRQSSPPELWWVDDFSCKVTLTQWIRNQVTGSGFIRWLQPSWQAARWAGRTNGHWFFNKGPEAVSQPGHVISFLTGLAFAAWWPDWHPITGQHIGILSSIHPHNPVQCSRTRVNEYDHEVQ